MIGFMNLKFALASAAILSSLTSAQAAGTATFVAGDTRGNFTFAVSLAKGSDDFFFHMSAPADYQWLAAGIGKRMTGSLMIVAYAAKDKQKVTASPRIATGNSEPSYTADHTVDVLPGSGLVGDNYVLNGKCNKCRSWKGGSLDVESSTQDWIFALGPGQDLNSDSKQANLRRHENYGSFTMDMKEATADSDAKVPTDFSKMSGASPTSALKFDFYTASKVHAIFMAFSFVVLLPLGVMWLRYFGKITLHWLNNMVAVVCILVGMGLGVKASMQYNKSKSFTAPHQIIGFIVVAFVAIQPIGGFIHHRMYKMTQRKSPIGMAHRIGGAIIILLGMVNGAVGLNFAGSNRRLIPYGLGIVFLALIFSGLLLLKRKKEQRKALYNTARAQNFQEGLAEQQQQQRQQQQQGYGQGQAEAGYQLNQMGGQVGQGMPPQPPPEYQQRFDADGRRMV
ncbi:MAG: hypothetical protein M1832_005680 [Thelocarpon impressellum]|nr:MAG: hypothetical protein M1832_005680 [Thelocarpon impressellum]